MTAPLTSRRHYVNGAPQAILNTGINASVTTFALSTGTGWPTLPFPLILDFEGAAEEAALITAMSGATVTNCTRGYDGTTAQAHSVGATCVHGIIAKDAEEASQHTSSTGAHGTTTAVVGKDDAQTLTNKTISSSTHQATSTDPAVNAKANAAGSAPVITATDSTGATTLFQVPKTGPIAMAAAAVTGALTAASAALTGALSAASAAITGLLTAGSATISGALSAGSVASSGAVTGNNLPAVPAALAGKRIHRGTASITTDGSGNATVTHGAGFTPTVIVPTALLTAGFSGVIGVDTVGATTFRVRLNTAGVIGPLTLMFICWE